MTQYDIIEMARQAGFIDADWNIKIVLPHLEAFAKLVSEKEREECAKLRKTIWCPDSKLKGAVNNALDFYEARILARKEVGDVNPV
jgi:hypothetical protein